MGKDKIDRLWNENDADILKCMLMLVHMYKHFTMSYSIGTHEQTILI